MSPLHRSAPDVPGVRRRTALRALLVAPLALALAGTPGVDGPPVAQAAGTSSFLQIFTPANESNDLSRTRQDAIADARRFNVIVAPQNTYDSYVQDMKAANPQLVLLGYMNGTFAQKSQGSTYPESWYVRDRSGNKVRSRGYGNFMMNPNNPGWVEERVQACRALLARSRYDGCMLDMLGTAPTQASYVTSPGINPATRRPWTAAEWQRATTALATRVRNGNAGSTWGNGYGSATRYFSAEGGGSRTLSAGVDGALTEIWMRTAHQGLDAPPSPTAWKHAVDQLVDLGRTGGRTGVLVKMWANGTQAKKDAVHRFALSTFLLGSNGKSAFYASYREGDALAGHRYWNAPIGTPTGGYTMSGGVAQRPFTAGRVVVNPTSSSVTVRLGGTYRDLSGTTRSTITLPPHSGDVLVRVR